MDPRFFLLGVSMWPLIFYPLGLLIIGIIAHRKRKGAASFIMVFAMLGVVVMRIVSIRVPPDASQDEIAMHFQMTEMTIWGLQLIYAVGMLAYFLSASRLKPGHSAQVPVPR